MVLANEADDTKEILSTLWHSHFLDRDADPDSALKLLQLAQWRVPPDDSMNTTLFTATAAVYALMGRNDDVNRNLSRALDSPPPSSDFEQAGLHHDRARCYLALGQFDTAEYHAIQAVHTWPAGSTRELAKGYITVATTHAIAGDSSAANWVNKALETTEAIHSARARAQLAPLQQALRTRKDSTSQDLAHRAHLLQAA